MPRTLAFALVATLLAGCSHGPVTVVQGDSASPPRTESRASSAGRADGAGGSHAPGSTGLGSGTFGIDSRAEEGAAR